MFKAARLLNAAYMSLMTLLICEDIDVAGC